MYGCHGLFDAVILQSLAFYLAQLNAVTSQLHLSIDTAEVFQLSLFVPAAEVASAIATLPHEHKELVGIIFQRVQIASCHTLAADNQFSCHTSRQQSYGFVDDK